MDQKKRKVDEEIEKKEEEKKKGEEKKKELVPSLSNCISSIAPIEDIVKQISDFLYRQINQINESFLEIEAKFGVLIDKSTNQRISLPISSEAVVKSGDWFRFESDIQEVQHKNLNRLLNSLVENSCDPGKNSKIYYKHVKEVDYFFELNDGTKVRGTAKEEGGEFQTVLSKRKIGHLHIYMPNSKFDCRISASLEIPSAEKLSCERREKKKLSPVLTRQKDRISYKHEIFKFDLTKVCQQQSSASIQQQSIAFPSSVSFEFEIELDSQELIQQKHNLEKGTKNSFSRISQVFMNNIRFISKKITN